MVERRTARRGSRRPAAYRIEDGHVRARELRARHPDAEEVGGVVQRRERHAALDGGLHRLVHHRRRRERRTAVHDAVPNDADVTCRANQARVGR